jgi:hypothetical protein
METLRRSSRQRKSRSALELLGIKQKHATGSFRDTDCVKRDTAKPLPYAQNPVVKEAELSSRNKNHRKSVFSYTVTDAETTITNNLLPTEYLPGSCPAVLTTNSNLDDMDEKLIPESVEEHSFESKQLSTKSVSHNSEGNSDNFCVLLTVIPSKTTVADLGLMTVRHEKKSPDRDEAMNSLIFRNGYNVSTEVNSLEESSSLKIIMDCSSGQNFPIFT